MSGAARRGLLAGARLGVLWCLLAACAPTTYTRPGTTESQRERDLGACRLEGAARATESLPRFLDYRVDVSAFERGPYELESRMRFAAKNAAKEAYRRYFDEQVSAYVAPCMQGRGYQLGQLGPRQKGRTDV